MQRTMETPSIRPTRTQDTLHGTEALHLRRIKQSHKIQAKLLQLLDLLACRAISAARVVPTAKDSAKRAQDLQRGNHTRSHPRTTLRFPPVLSKERTVPISLTLPSIVKSFGKKRNKSHHGP